jgi:hypothetical protein
VTWYAQQLFATPAPAVLERLRATPGFGDAIYVVRDLPREVIHEVGAITIGADGPAEDYRTRQGPSQLPAGGLAIVRELCSRSAGGHWVDWFDSDAVDWDAIPEPQIAVLDRTHDVAAMFGADAGSIAPPRRVLDHFARIAKETRSTVAYFACHMWGGDTSDAFAWVWNGERGTSVFYRAIVEPSGDSEMFTEIGGVQATDAHGSRRIVGGNVLTLALLHFDLLLESGYWELHTRAFPWDDYKAG